jgi:hypothetical protein
MTHSTENCPAYLPPDKQKTFLDETEKMFDAANQRNIKIKFMVTGVGHVMYALVEADSFNALNGFFGNAPFKQDIQIEPVGDVQDTILAFREELKKR